MELKKAAMAGTVESSDAQITVEPGTKGIELSIERMVEYATAQDENEELIRNAMILFPYIQKEIISHGKAAQILGLHKLDLIALYSKLGIPYLDQTKEELESDLSVLQKIRSSAI